MLRAYVPKRHFLAVAWVHEDDKRFFWLYPEVIMCDVTEGTNSGKRPLYALLCKNRDNKYPVIFKCFMPSQQKWVFQWIFQTEFPELLGRLVCQRVQLIITDGDINEHGPFLDAILYLFPNAKHKLCMYHLVTQKFPATKVYINTSDPVEHHEQILHFIYSFYTFV